MIMFDKIYKLHVLKQLKINDFSFNLCFICFDQSVSSSVYRRLNFLLPEGRFKNDSEYKLSDLIDYSISPALVEVLYDSFDK